MIDKDSYGLKKERNVLQEPHKEKENNSKNSDDKSISSIFLLVVRVEIDSITAKPYIPQKS